MQPSTNTGRRLLCLGYIGPARVRYLMQEAADGWEVYRDGTLLKSGLATLKAALACKAADEARQEQAA